MGGGDLNLKKSWHPKTLKNVERVWIVEQKHEAEQKKIAVLQKELAEERTIQELRQCGEESGVIVKKEKRLEWMCQAPVSTVNKEEYLLGRRVDEKMIFVGSSKNAIKDETDCVPESTLNFQPDDNYIVVDLENKIREDPLVKMRRQEKEILQHHFVRAHLRTDLIHKTLKAQLGESKNKQSRKRKNKNESESDSSGENYDRQSSSKKHRRDDSRKRRHARDYDRRYQSRKENRNESRGKFKTEPRSPPTQPPKRSKLTSEEMEAKRQEMSDNAKWCEGEQKKKMRIREEEQRIKKAEDKRSRSKGDSFLDPILKNVISHSSVESRVRSNVNYIQRGRDDMEKNFARKYN